MTEIKAIDLSHHNGNVDFMKVKASGINTVILRTGYGKHSPGQVDKRFYEYYDKARDAGMFIGAYHYSYADGVVGAQDEAEAMLKIIGDRKFELPLFFDIEEAKHKVMSKKMCTQMVRAFCDILEEAHKWAGVYSYDTFFSSNLEDDIVQRYATWTARVENVKPKACKRYDIWQYSWKGKVDGIKGDVDMNYIYKDYPPAIKRAHLNGY